MSCILTGGHPLGSFPRSDPDHSEPPHRHSQPVARPKHYSRNGSRQPWSLATDMHSQRPSDGCATSSEKIIVLTKEICPPPVLQQLFYIVVFFVLVLKAGMQALFEIKKCFPNVHKPRPHGELRQFFIAAEEEVWDYAPIPPTERLVTAHTLVLKFRYLGSL